MHFQGRTKQSATDAEMVSRSIDQKDEKVTEHPRIDRRAQATFGLIAFLSKTLSFFLFMRGSKTLH